MLLFYIVHIIAGQNFSKCKIYSRNKKKKKKKKKIHFDCGIYTSQCSNLNNGRFILQSMYLNQLRLCLKKEPKEISRAFNTITSVSTDVKANMFSAFLGVIIGV